MNTVELTHRAFDSTGYTWILRISTEYVVMQIFYSKDQTFKITANDENN